MLSIIGTPIGNLEDFSLRAARTLLEVDVILAEDTRSVRVLLERAKQIVQSTEYKEEILNRVPRDNRDRQDDTVNTDSERSQNDKKVEESQKIISYYKEVEYQKLPQVMEWLAEGLHVALVSEAGMPVISDPGHLLVQTAQKHHIPLTVIPGPSSIHTALVASGVKFDHYQFVGFLPKKENERTKLFEKLQTMQENMGKIKLVFVAFESPERVQATLAHLYSQYPDGKVVLCRELTKKFEEIIFQPSAENTYRGEIVLIVDFA